MEQVHFYEGIQLEPPFSEDDYFALSAVNGAIGEASSSRLFLSLREDRGLCYSVYSAFAMSRTECLWMASANVSPAQLPELAAEMDRQLDELAERGLDDWSAPMPWRDSPAPSNSPSRIRISGCGESPGSCYSQAKP